VDGQQRLGGVLTQVVIKKMLPQRRHGFLATDQTQFADEKSLHCLGVFVAAELRRERSATSRR
jgi:hypothetical protein